MNAIDDEIAELKRRLAELEARRAAETPTATEAPQAKAAPVPAPKNNYTPLIFVGAIVAALLVLVILNPGPSPTAAGPSTSVSTSTATAPASEPSSPTAPETPANWTYSDERDAMTDKATHLACTTSTNMVRLEAPYSPVDAKLCIRKSPKYGLDVFVALNGDGQILCTSYEGCTVHVRYDGHPRTAISASGASDGSSNVVFLRGEPRIIEQLKRTGIFRVELEFYQAGDQSLEFNTAGFQWTPVVVKAKP